MPPPDNIPYRDMTPEVSVLYTDSSGTHRATHYPWPYTSNKHSEFLLLLLIQSIAIIVFARACARPPRN